MQAADLPKWGLAWTAEASFGQIEQAWLAAGNLTAVQTHLMWVHAESEGPGVQLGLPQPETRMMGEPVAEELTACRDGQTAPYCCHSLMEAVTMQLGPQGDPSCSGRVLQTACLRNEPRGHRPALAGLTELLTVLEMALSWH